MASLVSVGKILDDLEVDVAALKTSRLRGAQWRHILNRLAAIERSITGFIHIPRSP